MCLVAEKIATWRDGGINQSQDEFDWLEIAKYELGTVSSPGELIGEKGVTLHSFALIMRKRRFEIASCGESAKVMISTTTSFARIEFTNSISHTQQEPNFSI